MKLTRMLKGMFVLVVVGAVVLSGVALAQTDETPLFPHRAERLAELVEDGVITQAEADAILEGLATDALALGRFERGPGAGLAAAAEVLGMEVAELRAQLLQGETIAGIAGDRVDEVIEAMVADRAARIEAALEAGRLTSEEAAERLAELEAHVTEFVNSPFEPKQYRYGDRSGPGFGPGPAGFAPRTPEFGAGDCDPQLWVAGA